MSAAPASNPLHLGSETVEELQRPHWELRHRSADVLRVLIGLAPCDGR